MSHLARKYMYLTCSAMLLNLCAWCAACASCASCACFSVPQWPFMVFLYFVEETFDAFCVIVYSHVQSLCFVNFPHLIQLRATD